jgi:Signal transduction histidine kinase
VRAGTMLRHASRAGSRLSGVARTCGLCAGLPIVFVVLGHVNMHVVGGAEVAPGRLVVPALTGLVIGVLVNREVGRVQRRRATLAALDAARREAVEAAAARDRLLAHLRMQVRHLRSEQAASVVAVGAVHDLRNMLMPVASAADLLQEDPTLASEVAPQLAAAATRGRELCNRILEARAGDGPDPVDLDSEAALDDALRLSVALLGRDVGVRLALAPARIRIDWQDFVQIVHNVVMNSSEAQPGELRLEVCGVAEGQVYRISIRDNGPGLPAGFGSERHRSSEGEGEVHGIGLRVVHAMARRNAQA